MTAVGAIKIEKRQACDPLLWLERHGDFLYRFALAKIRRPAVAEDLVQETLLAALKARRDFAGRSTERTWLTGILKHKIIDHFRRAGRVETSLDETSEDNPENELYGADGHWKPETTPRDWRPGPAELLEQKEFGEVLEKCLAELPERLASVFILTEINGLSREEICRLLEISPENLYVMLHRARLRLRELLEKNWFIK